MRSIPSTVISFVSTWAANAADWFVGVMGRAIDIIGPLAFAAIVAVTISALAAAAPYVSSGLLSFIGERLMAAVGLLPHRKKVWGTVYDAQTKRPVPYARVQLLDRNKRVLETRVADRDGRYGFLTTPESLQAQNTQISILPVAPGYLFPSRMPPSVDTFLYNNLYYGTTITVDQNTLINFDIPMDPLRPSIMPLVLRAPSVVIGASIAVIADIGFWLGLIIVPIGFALDPTPFTLGAAFLFLGAISLRVFGLSEHPYGVVKDRQTGHAVPFALVTLNEPNGKRVAFTVSDERGRYFMVVPKGAYELVASTSAMVQPTRQAKELIQVRKGWITREIVL